MLSLPQRDPDENPSTIELVAEGSSDINPVIITSTKTDLDNLLLHIYERQGELSLEYLLSILKMSHFYLIDDGFRYALDALDKHPGLTAPLRMSLALQYNHHDWIEPASLPPSIKVMKIN
ncbi:uncharacterized protein STEHIDRAFT_151319 [Stereum hirsutum FP-91666 SS1]|uniref:uncharacterized protein n=1 Tax=Stereum hirsutum (strain FP-91666) TaxID=721885 RepID=UPI000440C89A|nr:uncharacterized protein STEHIDRAFT_151319 [Stereum hirsutum FP-91666 SS1]EIM91966.1 hypothetical protein STEHIDRAFT_151319 [Stereum hirsutum FP-91666 SS1]